MEPNQPYQYQPYDNNSPAPIAPEAPPAPTWKIPAILVMTLATLVLVTVSVAVRSQNLLPAWVPVLGMDSGVAACKAISEGAKPIQPGEGDEFTQDDYREFRQVFADSRYSAIRDNGVKLIDNAWQIRSIPEGEEMGALAYVGALTSAYAGLSGGCAEVGYPIPALNAQ